MPQTPNSKQYGFEDRSFRLARDVIEFAKVVPKTMANVEATKMRFRICPKEAEESRYWLNIVEASRKDAEGKRRSLINQAGELMRTFASILEKTE